MKHFALALFLLSSQALAQAPQPPQPKPTSLSCRIIESVGDPESENVKRQIYSVEAVVKDTDSEPQLTGNSRFVTGVEFEIFGCASCGREGSTKVSNINVTIRDTKTGFKTTNIFRTPAVGTFELTAQTFAFICTVY